ncbi:MAG: mRNA surveillance protein pelota [Candidatus Diapherotrites archaeon]|nr:mRNA surveillance protein pelota [Candidatus Diapherotrites archaeon]
MQLVFVDRKTKSFAVIPETLEDLWLLEKVIEPGDEVEGTVIRRVKREDERGSGQLRKVFVRIRVESVDFHEYSGALRVGGIVIEARPEDVVGKGKHQTLEVRQGRSITVRKAVWSEYAIDQIREAVNESKKPKVLLVSIDDESATVFTLSQSLRRLAIVRNPHRGKRMGSGDFSEFYGQVLRVVDDSEPEIVIVGGPGFFYEDFIRFAQAKGSKKRYIGVRTAMAGTKGIHEIVADRLNSVIQEHHLSQISQYLDEFLRRLAKGDPVAVGDEVEQYAQAGAVDVLLIHENFLLANRERAREILTAVRNGGGKIFIIPRSYSPGTTVEKMGGMVAILRYR